jgi:hypothetical protein
VSGRITTQLSLPRTDGTLYPYTLLAGSTYSPPAAPLKSRVVYAAAHVVADPLADNTPGQRAKLDWEATLAYRRHLWRYGLAVAEAMDTAQRGMGLDWEGAKELIRRATAEAKVVGGSIACGAGTDHLQVGPDTTLDAVIGAYEEQCEFVEQQGSQIILMASRALAACARGPEDYFAVYDRILSQVREPVIIHWLGDMFDPALTGYWGAVELTEAMESCLAVIRQHAAKIDGIKISLLDANREIAMRRRLPKGVRMYTGDDFNYPKLILGDAHGYSDALLGIFDAIAPAAAAALAALDTGDVDSYHARFEPTLPLSRHIFQRPTYYYKTGIVFLAYLNGHQSHFRMVGGQESARSVPHLAELLVLADEAGLIQDPELAAQRMRHVLALAGIAS